MSKATHSPLPWIFCEGAAGYDRYAFSHQIYCAEDWVVALLCADDYEVAKRAEANAVLIVKAVNHHADLVKALDELVFHVSEIINDSDGVNIRSDTGALHRREDGIVPWGQLTGSCWLGSLNRARAVLNKVKRERP